MSLQATLGAAIAAVAAAQVQLSKDIVQTATDMTNALKFSPGGTLNAAQIQPFIDQLNGIAANLSSADAAIMAADPAAGLQAGHTYELKTDNSVTATYIGNDAGTVITPASQAGASITFGGVDNWNDITPPQPQAPNLPVGVQIGG